MENEDSTKRTEIGSLGEFGLIDKITSDFPLNRPSSIKGIGDDAAVIACGDTKLIWTTDMLIEGIHFDLMYHPLKHLGYKAIIANLSDICAMNAEPTQVVVTIGISNRFSVEAVEELYAGIRAACEQYNVDLVGGDTCSSNRGLILSVSAIGFAREDDIVYRHTARPGDILAVTGNLGAAYLGLQLLEREKQIYLENPEVQPDLEGQRYAVGRQLKPEARLDMVQYFAKVGFKPTAMIDISDGLSSDLMHICKHSAVGAIVEEAHIPVHHEAEHLALKFKLDPSTCALHGGEDYELLFTASPDELPKLRVMPDTYILGEITDAKEGVKLHTTGGNIHELQAQGWTHF